jgi:hypothetical protein
MAPWDIGFTLLGDATIPSIYQLAVVQGADANLLHGLPRATLRRKNDNDNILFDICSLFLSQLIELAHQFLKWSDELNTQVVSTLVLSVYSTSSCIYVSLLNRKPSLHSLTVLHLMPDGVRDHSFLKSWRANTIDI